MYYSTSLCRKRYPDHPVVARALLNEAEMLQTCCIAADFENATSVFDDSVKRHDISGDEFLIRAETLLKEAIELCVKNYDANHSITLQAVVALGDLLIGKRGFLQAFEMISVFLEVNNASNEIPALAEAKVENNLCLPFRISEDAIYSEENPPFCAVFPSLKTEHREVWLGELHRIAAQCLIKLKPGDAAIQEHVEAAKKYFGSHLEENHSIRKRLFRFTETLSSE